MTRTVRRFVAVLVVALALLGILASTAFATLEDTPTPTMGTSMSNPGWGPDAWWRGGWGNTLHPDFELNPPSIWNADGGPGVPPDGYLLGMIYTVDRSLATVIDTQTPDNYYRATFPTAITSVGGTNLDHSLDMLGIYMNPPAGGWPAMQAGAHNPLEGAWVLHYSFYSNFRYQFGQWEGTFGVDLTPPRAVTGLRLRTGLTTSDVTTWTPATRALISWDASQTDDLSGDGYFQVLVDDKPLIPETSTTPVQGRAYAASWLPTPSSITVENMPAGKHKVSVVPVDRATNVGPPTSAYFYSDPDTPTISFTSPTTSILSTKSIFSVDASDAAGPPVVTMSLDSSGLTTLTAPPYSYKPDLSNLGSGSHTLTATATDHLGRTVTITKTVSFSNTITSSGFMTAGPSEFVNWASETAIPADNQWRIDPIDQKVWTNDLHPQFTLTAGSEIATLAADSGGTPAGMLYDLRRLPELIDAATPDAYFRSWRPQTGNWTTHMDTTLDLASVMAYPPPAGWPAPEPGAEQAVEGTWYLQYKGFLNNGWAESATNVVKFGVDVTPPSTVDSLAASPTTDTTMAGLVSAGTRTHITWLSKDYDALSGVAFYQVLLDGVKVIPEESGDPQGRVFDFPGRAEPAVTIENLTPGKHLIEVYAVDRAGNAGKSVGTTVFSDPDVPQIAFIRPSGNQIGVSASLEVSASDVGGVKSVVFQLDGTTVLTQTSAPYSGTADLSAFGNGDHTLTATVTDMFGRQVTIAKTVTLDKTALTISSFSRNYATFYPIKRDKYYDNLTISFYASKTCSARVLITNSAGALVRSISKSAGAGRSSVTWDGKWAHDNKAHTGTYYIQVTASDTSGNTYTTGKLKTVIKNYQVVKLSHNRVKIISR